MSEASQDVAKRNICGLRTEIYSRVCGYHRPTTAWNRGKRAEFKDRKVFANPEAKGVKS